MDPDSGSKSDYKNVFVDCSAKTPEISFKEELGIKYFDTASMIDDTESIVLSSAVFDSNYNLLQGELYVMRLEYDEYSSIKNSLGKDVDLMEMMSYSFNPIETIMLTTGPNGRKYEKLVGDDVTDACFRDSDFSNLALEDRQLSSTTDYMNNYLIKYGTCRGLSADSFKSFEQAKRAEQLVQTNDKAKIIHVNMQSADKKSA